MTRPSWLNSLFWRIYVATVSLVVLAWAFLAFTPATIKPPVVVTGVIGLAGLILLLLVDMILLRRALRPLDRLTDAARSYDPLRPGRRIPVYAEDDEIVQLTNAFNQMLDRLEDERRESAHRALAAQEDERARIARELHDEIGQSLTAVLLGVEHALRTVPSENAQSLEMVRETARSSLEEVRRIAQRLRPEALDDLGLRSALMHLTERIATQSRFHVSRSFESKLPPLSPQKELVIYRVAQEALTNVVRHANAQEVDIRLEARDGSAILIIRDDGAGSIPAEGSGLKGMRERAILVGGDLSIDRRAEGGLQVRLAVAGDPQ